MFYQNTHYIYILLNIIYHIILHGGQLTHNLGPDRHWAKCGRAACDRQGLCLENWAGSSFQLLQSHVACGPGYAELYRVLLTTTGNKHTTNYAQSYSH